MMFFMSAFLSYLLELDWALWFLVAGSVFSLVMAIRQTWFPQGFRKAKVRKEDVVHWAGTMEECLKHPIRSSSKGTEYGIRTGACYFKLKEVGLAAPDSGGTLLQIEYYERLKSYTEEYGVKEAKRLIELWMEDVGNGH